jgi:nitroimidazol reductase NimA-like FMN-containing flavoprotein (pyridoxamine 5'-phosphate oxidase superfamily)
MRRSDAARAKQILSEILYITIATVDAAGRPWNAPVYSAYDEEYNFYWASAIHSEHSRNIRGNPNIFLVIYDSTVPEGTGEGVYIQAKAYELADEHETKAALRYYYGRANKAPPSASAFLGSRPRRIYKAVPERVWMNDLKEVDDTTIDVRIEIELT